MKKLFWGLFFIAAGAFVIVNQLGNYTDINLFTLLLTILILPILIQSLLKINFTGILFSLAFLCILYSEPLHLENLTPFPILITALLGSIGLSIMFPKHHPFCEYDGSCDHAINSEDTDVINLDVNFGSSIKYINSDDFKVANLRSSFGSMKVYFDNAKIKGDSASINLDVSFSGVELFIPKEWNVVNKVDVSLGSVEEKNSKGTKFTKTVTLTGRVSFGGVEIIYI